MAEQGYRDYVEKVGGQGREAEMSQSQGAVPSYGLVQAGESRTSRFKPIQSAAPFQQIPSRQSSPQTTSWGWSSAFDSARGIVRSLYGSARDWTQRTLGWGTPRYTIPSHYTGENRRLIQEEMGPQYGEE